MFDLRFLNNLKQKLTTGNRGSIYLNALPERYLSRLDLADLNHLNPSFADAFFDTLTTNTPFRFSLTPDGKVRDERTKTQLDNVLRRLAMISIENNDHFSEQGVKTFGLGFPILLYRDTKAPNRLIKAPMFIWYLDIERNFKRANEWILTRNEDSPVIHNVVLAAYLHNNAEIKLTPIYAPFLEDALLDKNELAKLTSDQLRQLHPNLPTSLNNEFRASLDQPIQRIPSRQQLDGMHIQETTVLWSGVFGLFKSQKESIINDLNYFVEHIEQLQEQIEQQTANKQLMQHCFTAVDTDPSQQHLLHLLEKGSNLVIQGPPGTGKSQTLTGIIANVLANGGTCLVVCEKKTALEVVQQNLIDIGLGELTVIIEDVYRDRQAVVNSVRERAQKQYPSYTTYPSYLRLLENCARQVEQLQNYHYHQLKPLLEEQTWSELVHQFLAANERYDKQLLDQVLTTDGFEFNSEELESIFPIFEEGKALLAPIQTLDQPLNAVHNRFFRNSTAAQAKLNIQRSITTALRATRKAKETIETTQQRYEQQLEGHYYTLYLKKLRLVDDLHLQSKSLIQEHLDEQVKRCHAAQQMLTQFIKHYQTKLSSHFEELYSLKILGIDQTATLIKEEIYGVVDQALETIKEAKEDIMASLYEYERLLEQHFEDIYMQKMDLVDMMTTTIETGFATSPFYFKKNKGMFRAILHGIGAKYKQLEQDKLHTIKQFAQLQKLHQQHKYFQFEFITTKDKSAFTFEELLKHIETYREAVDAWHLKQHSVIHEEVQKLSSRYSLKAVPYKKEAQIINQHLSNFRSKILRNKLLPIEFKYDNLRLRGRFDQLEIIEAKIQKIKGDIDKFVTKNEATWNRNTYDKSLDKDNFQTAFQELQRYHYQHNYFEQDFIKLGRPSKIEDYYHILRHLNQYRTKVEAWYPTRLPIIESYQNNFKLKNLYPPLNFKTEAEQLEQALDTFVETYNHSQLLGLPFQLEGVLFQEQVLELNKLAKLLNNWGTNFEHFLLEHHKEWIAYPIKGEQQLQPIISLEALQETYQQLMDLHQQHDYFDYTFEVYAYSNELLDQQFIQNLAHYRKCTTHWYDNRSITIQNKVNYLSSENISPHVLLAQEIDKVERNLQEFQQGFNMFEHFEALFEFKNAILGDQLEQVNQLEEQIVALQNQFGNFEDYYNFRLFWMTLNKAQQTAYKGLSKAKPDNWAEAFTSWYLHAFLSTYEATIPHQESYNKHRNLLIGYTIELKKMLVAHSLRYWRFKQTKSVKIFHQEKAPIKLHSLYNKRGHAGGRRTSLRKIIATSSDLFMSFFPVLLVSPSVCSAILPLKPSLFDVVVFDEASQLRLEDTFCALIRGRYKVISGDSQQMPPSDYFQSNTVLIHEEKEEDSLTLVKESIDFLTTTESLLEYALATGNYKESFLEVHYRSKHPYLIDFSNAAFYGNRLSPMPNQKNYVPIDFFDVNGLYSNYTNITEATQIIDYIVELVRPYQGKSSPSVGIATFNIHQRNLILEMIQERVVQNSKDGAQLQKLFMKGLFVKNLENIQGDERDVLIISTTFGLREDGSFIQNFGPINRQKGYRLLNVIITRAKQKLAVFTSIPSKYYEGYRDEINEKGNVGKAVFYAYLAYAKAVYQKDEDSRKAILQLLHEHCLQKPIDGFLYQKNDNIFKKYVTDFLIQHFPDSVITNYNYAGFEIPLVVKDAAGKPCWAFDFDTFHKYQSEEAYAWDLFREHHLKQFGLNYHRIWSKDWWKDETAAKTNLLSLMQ